MKGIRYARTEEGFEAWLGNNSNFLHYMIRHYYFGSMERSDIFQEVCFAAWKGYSIYDSAKGVKLTTYIGECVKNCIFEIYRKETALRRPKTVNIGLAHDFDDEMSDYVLYEESFPSNYQYLFDAINTLEGKEFDMMLEAMSEKTQMEIADKFGCSQGLVSGYLKKARNAVREKIA